MATPVPCQKATCPAGATCVAGPDNACTVTGGSSTDCTNQTGLTCAPGMYKVSKYTSASNGAKGPTCELSCQECGCVAAAPSPPPSSFAARLGDAPAAGTCIQDEGGAMVCTTSVTDQKNAPAILQVYRARPALLVERGSGTMRKRRVILGVPRTPHAKIPTLNVPRLGFATTAKIQAHVNQGRGQQSQRIIVPTLFCLRFHVGAVRLQQPTMIRAVCFSAVRRAG